MLSSGPNGKGKMPREKEPVQQQLTNNWQTADSLFFWEEPVQQQLTNNWQTADSLFFWEKKQATN